MPENRVEDKKAFQKKLCCLHNSSGLGWGATHVRTEELYDPCTLMFFFKGWGDLHSLNDVQTKFMKNRLTG